MCTCIFGKGYLYIWEKSICIIGERLFAYLGNVYLYIWGTYICVFGKCVLVYLRNVYLYSIVVRRKVYNIFAIRVN